jgi:thioesterase domain-containing protein
LRVDKQELEKYLHEHIPLSGVMGVAVVEASREGVTLSAPLKPNINHRETVFGGSASAVAILAAWSLVHLRLTQEGIDGRLVIQRNSMNYERPMTGIFIAVSSLRDPTAWDRFVAMFKRKNRARITVVAALFYGGEKAGEFEGEFVALGGPPTNE